MKDVTAHEVMDVVKRFRFPLSNEKRLQEALENKFIDHGLEIKREYRLSPEDIVDFYVNGLAIEVKIKSGKLDLYRQIERYAEHETVDQLLLITNVAMGFPPTVKGKPVYFLNLARAWM